MHPGEGDKVELEFGALKMAGFSEKVMKVA